MTPPQQQHKCTPDDVDDVIRFLDKEKPLFYSKATVRRILCGDNEGRKPYDVFINRSNGEINGIAIVSSKSKTLSLLFVSESSRKQGIARALYEMANPKQLLIKRGAIGYFAKIDTSPRPAATPVKNRMSCIKCFHCGKQVSTSHNNLVFRATATCPECTESGKDIDPEHDAAKAREELLDEIAKRIEIAEEDEHDDDYWRGISRVSDIIQSLRSTTKEREK